MSFQFVLLILRLVTVISPQVGTLVTSSVWNPRTEVGMSVFTRVGGEGMQVSSLNRWEAQQEFLLHLEGRFILLVGVEFNLWMAGDRSEGLGQP